MSWRRVLLVSLPIIGSRGVAGQALPPGLTQMATALSQLKRYELAVRIRVADSLGQPLMSRVVNAARDTSRYLYRFDSTLALVTPSATILIDRARHTIAYSPAGGSAIEQPPATPNADSLLRAVDSVVTVSRAAASTRYRIFASRASISRTDVVVDDNTHLLREVAYTYRTAERGEAFISITYEWGTLLDTDSVRIETYIRVAPDGIEPTGDLVGYRVIKGTSS